MASRPLDTNHTRTVYTQKFFLILLCWMCVGFYRFYGLAILEKLGVIDAQVNSKVGLPLYDNGSLLLSSCFLFFVLGGQALIILKADVFKKIADYLQFDLSVIRISAILVLVIYFIKKLSVFFFARGYFENEELWSSRGDDYRILIHFFLPNLLSISACWLLLKSNSKGLVWLSLVYLCAAALAAFLFNSRGLFTVTTIIILIGFSSQMTGGGHRSWLQALGALIIALLVVLVLGSGYAQPMWNLSNLGISLSSMVSGISYRLDVIHLVTHVSATLGCVPDDLSNNWISRFIGVVSPQDMNTGVGYPLFLRDCTTNNLIGIVFGGILLGFISGLLAIFMSYGSTVVRAAALFPTIWIGFHWPELSVSDVGMKLTELFVVLSIIVLCAHFINRSKLIKGK